MLRIEAERSSRALLLGVGGGDEAVILEADDAPLSIGRLAEREVRLDHDGVSRHHANLHCFGSRWVLEDVSRYGTQIHEIGAQKPRTIHHARHDLGHQDYIRCGGAPWICFETYEPARTAPVSHADDAPRVSLDDLTPREREVVSCYLSSWLEGSGSPSNGALALRLGIGRDTVKSHLDNIRGKWGCQDRHAIVQRALDAGLLPDDAR